MPTLLEQRRGPLLVAGVYRQKRQRHGLFIHYALNRYVLQHCPAVFVVPEPALFKHVINPYTWEGYPADTVRFRLICRYWQHDRSFLCDGTYYGIP